MANTTRPRADLVLAPAVTDRRKSTKPAPATASVLPMDLQPGRPLHRQHGRVRDRDPASRAARREDAPREGATAGRAGDGARRELGGARESRGQARAAEHVMRRAALVGILIAGCASLRPLTEGSVGPVAWRAVDLQPSRDSYAFTLVLTETRGVGITYTEVQSYVYYPGTNHFRTVRQGRWRMEPRGELRMPFGGRMRCSGSSCTTLDAPTLWAFVFVGSDDRGEGIRTQFEVRLPVAGLTASQPRWAPSRARP